VWGWRLRRTGICLLFLVSVLLFGLYPSIRLVYAQPCEVTGVTTSVTNDVTETAGGSGSTTVNFKFMLTGDCIVSAANGLTTITAGCDTLTLPTGVSCPSGTQTRTFIGTDIGPVTTTCPLCTDDASFTFTFATSPSTLAGTYPMTITLSIPSPCPSTRAGAACFGDLLVGLTTGIETPSFNLIVNPAVIPEYPLGLPLLAILMLLGYTVLRRKTITNQARP